MNKENQVHRIQPFGTNVNDAVSYLSDDDGMELERCTHKKLGKMESGLSNFREKIKKSHQKHQSY